MMERNVTEVNWKLDKKWCVDTGINNKILKRTNEFPETMGHYKCKIYLDNCARNVKEFHWKKLVK